ncbi:MAG TPA: hypothetical protein DCE44_19065, partial [Verrucomicrobiales bacterium]|nr:hypothetical protein [Verrucomicrobiales bacterium]
MISLTGNLWAAGNLKSAKGNHPREPGLVGYWPLQGDCRDYSGHGNHGVNHGVDLDTGTFDGLGAFIEVPSSDSFRFGTRDFALCAWIHTEKELDDVVGDVLDLYDSAGRRGITLSVNSSASGYLSQGTDRHVYFGIDNAQSSDWQDCGRPSRTSRYISNSMLVYQGKLYAAIIDAENEKDWCHVFRYEGKQRWVDCGRVGGGRTTGVGPLLVHQGNLYAVTTTYDWTRVQKGPYDAGRVYRYAGGSRWVDCGQPSDDRTLNCAASYQGRLYVGGGPQTWGVFVQGDHDSWSSSKIFSKQGPQRCFPHAMSRYNGKLFVAYPGVYAFDGAEWAFAGIPAETERTLQTHSLTVYQGKLTAGTWPMGKVSRYLGGETWEELGRVGEDGTEVNSLVVYNGKLYGGSIPRSEVCRYDGNPQWTSLKRFYSPEGWTPVPPADTGGRPTVEQVAEWSRVTSITVFGGRLFAGIGSCTSAVIDSPADIRGRVFSMEAGKCVSYDDELHPGWRHLAAVRHRGRLSLYVDGKLVAKSTAFDPAAYDV